MNIEPSNFQLELRLREMIRNLKVKLKCQGEEHKGRCNIYFTVALPTIFHSNWNLFFAQLRCYGVIFSVIAG